MQQQDGSSRRELRDDSMDLYLTRQKLIPFPTARRIGATDNRVEIKRGVRAGETVVASATFLVDAESNLGSALGGMGGMPGMDVSPPVRPAKPEN